jgi:hypothetical protein
VNTTNQWLIIIPEHLITDLSYIVTIAFSKCTSVLQLNELIVTKVFIVVEGSIGKMVGRPRVLKKSRDKVYYGIPVRIKNKTIQLADKLEPKGYALNEKLYRLLKELEQWRNSLE